MRLQAHSLLVAFLGFLSASGITAAAPKLQQLPTDTTVTRPPDSTLVADTLRVRFIPGIGTLRPVDSSSTLHSTHFSWTDSKTVGEVLRQTPGFFFRDLGEPGKPQQLSSYGTDWRGIAVMLDGRPLNDPVTGTYNLHDLPIEFLDEIAVSSGAEARLYSPDAAGSSLNFVSKQYSSVRPVTKIRFIQEQFDNLLTDGLYTQNVARGANLMLGFQRHVTLGRFKNARLDAWSLRSRLRYNISDQFNISVMDLFTKSVNGLNGGIDIQNTTTIFEEVSAEVKNRNAFETVSRHDLTLSAIGKFFEDSSWTTNFILYQTAIEREYDDPATLIQPTAFADLHKSGFSGMTVLQSLNESILRFQFGAQTGQKRSEESRTVGPQLESSSALFVKAGLSVFNLLEPAVFVRREAVGGESGTSTGLSVALKLSDGLSLFGEMSSSVRFPTLQELYWNDSTVSRPQSIQKESHTYVEGGAKVSVDSWLELSLSAWQRTVKDAVLFRPSSTQFGTPAVTIVNVPEVRSQGVNGSVALRPGQFEILGTLTANKYQEGDSVKTLVPDLMLHGELSYRDRFFDGALDAKFGVRSEFYNRHRGMVYSPPMLIFLENTGAEVGRFTVFDLYALLQLGDARICLAWKNLGNVPYYITPVYPMPGRHFRLSVDWVFSD
ncbi:MAG: TonB-dependent receptor [Bacteroidota bacterium]